MALFVGLLDLRQVLKPKTPSITESVTADPLLAVLTEPVLDLCPSITTYMPASGARQYGACLFLYEIVDKYSRKLVGQANWEQTTAAQYPKATVHHLCSSPESLVMQLAAQRSIGIFN